MLKVGTSFLPHQHNDSYSSLVARLCFQGMATFRTHSIRSYIGNHWAEQNPHTQKETYPSIANWVEQFNYWESWKAMKLIDVEKQTTDIEYKIL